MKTKSILLPILFLISLIFLFGCASLRNSTSLPSDDFAPCKLVVDNEDSNTYAYRCAEGYGCYNISPDREEQEEPFCYSNSKNPCDLCSSRVCEILESNPVIIQCR